MVRAQCLRSQLSRDRVSSVSQPLPEAWVNKAQSGYCLKGHICIWGANPLYTQCTPLFVIGTQSSLGDGGSGTLGWGKDVCSV